MEAYGFKKEEEILTKLLALNLELAEKEKQGLSIIGAKIFDILRIQISFKIRRSPITDKLLHRS